MATTGINFNGGSGNDLLNGGTGDDKLSGGSGDDTLYGGAGSDQLKGGSGNDILDGGAGADRVDGDSGNDVLVYVAAENVDRHDVYDGGAHIDTLRLVLTRDEWMRADVQRDIASYLQFIAAHANPTGATTGHSYEFTAFRLTATRFEKLEVNVDGIALDPRDAAVTLARDSVTATEDAAAAVNVLANDTVPDLVKAISYTQPAHGTVELIQLDLSTALLSPVARFSYTPDAAHWQYLAVGESATDSFTYTVTDADGDVRTETVDVTILGSNDAPTIVGGDFGGAVVEGNSTSFLTDAGSITFEDVDLSDTHSVAVGAAEVSTSAGVPSGFVPAAGFGVLSAWISEDVTDLADEAEVNWSFAVNDALVQGLAAGETVTQEYTLTVTDSAGAPVTQKVTVTIAGTNDAPVITSAAQSGSVTEVADNGAGENACTLSTTGAVTFSDVDASDVHNASFTPQASGYLGTFSLSPVHQAGDSVGWTFSVADAALDSLAAGQTLTQSYDIAVSDGRGGTATQTVSVSIIGTNDAPVISAGGPQQVVDFDATQFSFPSIYSEDGLTFSTPTHLHFDHDVDGDGHPELSGHNGGSETFFIEKTGGGRFSLYDMDTAPYSGGAVQWTAYALNSSNQLVQTGQIVITGGQHVTFGAGFQNIDRVVWNNAFTGNGGITIDNLRFSAGAGVQTTSYSVAELADNAAGENITTHSHAGTIAFTDVDTLDTHTASVTPQGAGYLGSLTLGTLDQATDTLGWSFAVADTALDSLAAGQTLTQNYDVTVNDGRGGTATQTITVTITGASDAPVAVDDTLSTTEDTAVVVSAATLLANDSGDTKTLVSVQGASNGSVSFDGTSVVFTPNSNYYGPATYTYTMKDSTGLTSTASVAVTVNGVADAPTLAVGSSTTLAPTVGAAMRTTLTLNAGDVVSYDWSFVAHDYMPFNDFAFATVNGAAFMLAAVEVVGDYGSTGWKTFNYTVQSSGTYDFGMGQMNVNDQALNSHLLVDNLRVNGTLTQSFESGTFSGWSTNGTTAVVADHDGVAPTHGARMALLDSQPSSASTLESFLGLSSGRLANIVKASGLEYTPVTVPVAITIAPGEQSSDTFVTIAGAPAGAVFNHGALDPVSGNWIVDAGDIGGNLTVTPPSDFTGSFTLSITATTQLPGGGSSATTAAQTLSVTIDPAPVNLAGSAGADTLKGGPLGDTISGLGGNDVLIGGGGNDHLNGGADSDTFVYTALTEAGSSGDVISGFTTGVGGDVLDLHDVLQAFTGYDGTNAFAGQYLNFAESSGNTEVQVDSNGGGDSYVTLATLTNVLLTPADVANYIV